MDEFVDIELGRDIEPSKITEINNDIFEEEEEYNSYIDMIINSIISIQDYCNNRILPLFNKSNSTNIIIGTLLERRQQSILLK